MESSSPLQAPTRIRRYLWMFAAIVVAIIVVETIVMLLLAHLGLRGVLGASLDPILLGVLMTPVLYWLFVRPLRRIIDERNAAAAEAQNASIQLRGVLSGAEQVAVIGTDVNGMITLFSPGAEHMLGYSANELIGRVTPTVFLSDSELENRAEELSRKFNVRVDGFSVFSMKTLLDGSEQREWTCVTKNGRRLVVHLTVSAVRSKDGEVIGFLGIATDITKLKEAEATLRRQAVQLQANNEALKQAERGAQAASQAKSAFLANMSYELRTPMTAILGYTDLVAEECGCACSDAVQAVSAHVATIKRNGEYLLELINDILDLSRIEAGRLEFNRVPFPPTSIIKEVVSLLKIRADSKNLQLKAEFRGPIPGTIYSDPLRLRQLLVNLLGNAVKYTEVGSVRLIVETIGAGSDAPCLQFEVRDTGIGIPDDQLETVFEPFSRGDNADIKTFRGTGLGLTISKCLAQLLGGDISVESKVGEGSVFRFRVSTGNLEGIAMHEVSQANREVKELQLPEGLSCAEEPLDCSVLLVEDGLDNQRLISHVLRSRGARVELAENGAVGLEKALQALEGKKPYDVVLMDMMMPVMDGFQAVRRLREDGYSGPIVALTAHAMNGARQQCMQTGCDAFLTKPIDRRTLIQCVRELSAKPGVDAPGLHTS